jgi:hypothetical protein
MTTSNNHQESQTKKRRGTGLTTAVIVGLIPTTGYVAAFSHELGASEFWHIPPAYIVVNLTSVFVAVAGVVVLVFLPFAISAVAMLVESYFWGEEKPLATNVLVTILLIGYVVWVGLLTTGWMRWAIVAVLAAPVLFVSWLMPLIIQKEKVSYAEKVKAWFASDLAASISVIIWIMAAFIMFSYALGYSSQIRATKFTVVNTSPESVVIWVYNDNLLCAYFDRETKEIDKSYFVLNIAGGPEMTLTPEEVGPLHRK